MLQKHTSVFQGKRGEYNGGEVSIQLTDDAKPFWAMPYDVPLKNRRVMAQELQRQCDIGALRRLTPLEIEERQFAFSCFGVPKSNGSIRLVLDLRPLNKMVKRRAYPLPTIDEMLTSVGGFTFASSIDLNMGYLSIPLDEASRKILTIVSLEGFFECLVLPMGVKPATDIFQSRMVATFSHMDESRKPNPYLDDILHTKGESFDEHLNILDEILGVLEDSGFQVNADKSALIALGLEFLGFWLSRDGYRPLQKRVEAILKIKPPTTVKETRMFLGVINFIKNHIPGRAGILEPITRLTKKEEKFVWGQEQSKAFDLIKSKVAEKIMLTYPDLNKPFDIYPDASSEYAMGALLCQEGKTISTFSKKFNDAQLKYDVTSQELLAVVEGCRHFRNIIFGGDITIHSDHKNLCHDSQTMHRNSRVHRQRIELDNEYHAKFQHISGIENTGGDGLSRLPMYDEVQESTRQEIYSIDYLDRDENEVDYPLDIQLIKEAQDRDPTLQAMIKEGHPDIGLEERDEVKIYTIKKKIYIPPDLQDRIISWVHINMNHCGVTRTINSLKAIFHIKGLQGKVESYIQSCEECQRYKTTGTTTKKYGKIPLTPALRDKSPWSHVSVDCCGPFTIKVKNEETGKITVYKIQLHSAIDLCTGWAEFTSITSASSLKVSKAFDRTWLTRYPRPHTVQHDNGPEFMGEEFQELLGSFGITSRPTTVKNPQAQAIVERIHLPLEEALRTRVFSEDGCLEEAEQLIQTIAWGIRAVTASNNAYSPMQLAFGYEALFRIKCTVDWEEQKRHHRKQAEMNNAKENKSRKVHMYQEGDQILIMNQSYERRRNPKISPHTEGPYTILKVYSDIGIVKIQRGNYTDKLSIRRIKPYYPSQNG